MNGGLIVVKKCYIRRRGYDVHYGGWAINYN